MHDVIVVGAGYATIADRMASLSEREIVVDTAGCLARDARCAG